MIFASGTNPNHNFNFLGSRARNKTRASRMFDELPIFFLEQGPDFILSLTIDEISDTGVRTLSLENQPSRCELRKRFPDFQTPPLNLLLKQPPLDDTLECVLRAGVVDQIAQNVSSDF
jgi:hypothetical protein